MDDRSDGSHVNFSYRTYIVVGFVMAAITGLSMYFPWIISSLGLTTTIVPTVIIQMSLALLKSALLIVFFMHVRFDKPILRVFMLAALSILIIIFGITMIDIYFRYDTGHVV